MPSVSRLWGQESSAGAPAWDLMGLVTSTSIAWGTGRDLEGPNELGFSVHSVCLFYFSCMWSSLIKPLHVFCNRPYRSSTWQMRMLSASRCRIDIDQNNTAFSVWSIWSVWLKVIQKFEIKWTPYWLVLQQYANRKTSGKHRAYKVNLVNTDHT